MISSSFLQLAIIVFSFMILITILFKLLPTLAKELLKLKSEFKYEPYQSNSNYYFKRKKLLSPSELSFYKVLLSTLPNNIIIIPKVRQADILGVKKSLSRSQWQTAFNKISRKHYDFVLCSTDDFSIIAVIELDDKSHQKPSRISRDNFVDDSLNQAGLPLFRFTAKSSYNKKYIASKLYSLTH